MSTEQEFHTLLKATKENELTVSLARKIAKKMLQWWLKKKDNLENCVCGAKSSVLWMKILPAKIHLLRTKNSENTFKCQTFFQFLLRSNQSEDG